MENLPIEILEQILTDKNLSDSDIVNTLQTCKQLKSAIEGSNIIWKFVFKRRWSELLPHKKFPNHEKLDWFDEIKNNFNVKLQTRHLGASMSSWTNLKKNHFFPSDLIDWHELIAQGKYNHLYVLKYLQLIMDEECDINSFTAAPTAPGNFTLRFYCREVYYQLYQQRCLKILEELLKFPENFCTLDRCASIAAHLLEPYEDRTYEKIEKIMDTIANEVKKQLRNINPSHPLFDVPEDIQLSWKYRDHNIHVSTFEEDHVYQVFQAFRDLKIDFYTENECNRNCRDEIDLCLHYLRIFNRNTNFPTITIILESICRRLGVVFIYFVSIRRSFQICIKNQLTDFKIDIDETGMPNIRSVDNPRFETPPVAKFDRLTAGQVIVRMLRKELFWFDPLTPEVKFIRRLNILLEPDKFEHIKKYSRIFDNFKVCEEDWEENKSEYEGEKLERLLINHLNRPKKWKNVPDQQKWTDKSIEIGSVGTDMTGGCTVVVLSSSRKLTKRDLYEYNPLISEKEHFLVMCKYGAKTLITADDLRLDLNPTRDSCDCDGITFGKYFSHFFGKKYIPNKEWETYIDSQSSTQKLENVSKCKII